MINEDLLTPEQKRIAHLVNTIEAFKKYDEERKKYVHQLEEQNQNLQYQVEDLQAQLDEMSVENVSEKILNKLHKLEQKNKNLNINLQQCSTKLAAIKNPELIALMEDKDLPTKVERASFHIQINNLKKVIIHLRRTIADLVSRKQVTDSVLEHYISKLDEIINKIN